MRAHGWTRERAAKETVRAKRKRFGAEITELSLAVTMHRLAKVLELPAEVFAAAYPGLFAELLSSEAAATDAAGDYDRALGDLKAADRRQRGMGWRSPVILARQARAYRKVRLHRRPPPRNRARSLPGGKWAARRAA